MKLHGSCAPGSEYRMDSGKSIKELWNISEVCYDLLSPKVSERWTGNGYLHQAFQVNGIEGFEPHKFDYQSALGRHTYQYLVLCHHRP